MHPSTFTTVRAAKSSAEAGLFISLLQQAGLHPLPLDSAGHFSFAGAEVDYSIKVPVEESAQAREILNEYTQNSDA